MLEQPLRFFLVISVFVVFAISFIDWLLTLRSAYSNIHFFWISIDNKWCLQSCGEIMSSRTGNWQHACLSERREALGWLLKTARRVHPHVAPAMLQLVQAAIVPPTQKVLWQYDVSWNMTEVYSSLETIKNTALDAGCYVVFSYVIVSFKYNTKMFKMFFTKQVE